MRQRSTPQELPREGTISALHPTVRDPTRLTVKVDGRAVGTLSQKLIADLNLAVKDPWTPELADSLAGALLYDKAFRAATRRLARRAMSAGMVSDKLRELGHDPEVREAVMQRLDELGLIDDTAYAQMLIRETQRAKPAGPMLLRQKLMQKKVDRSLIDRLVAEATADPDDQRAAARQLVEKKLPSLARFDAATRKRRLYGQLARRGFTSDVISDAMAGIEDKDRQ